MGYENAPEMGDICISKLNFGRPCKIRNKPQKMGRGGGKFQRPAGEKRMWGTSGSRTAQAKCLDRTRRISHFE
jgi:hypothetical protein